MRFPSEFCYIFNIFEEAILGYFLTLADTFKVCGPCPHLEAKLEDVDVDVKEESLLHLETRGEVPPPPMLLWRLRRWFRPSMMGWASPPPSASEEINALIDKFTDGFFPTLEPKALFGEVEDGWGLKDPPPRASFSSCL